mmetsp:Transcript_7246/g.17296  ORF Transcript_7246/g.17296 Transcript_7246/m.17296 type:complete len:270 (+) Transcript_7246:547-1356(+)
MCKLGRPRPFEGESSIKSDDSPSSIAAPSPQEPESASTRNPPGPTATPSGTGVGADELSSMCTAIFAANDTRRHFFLARRACLRADARGDELTDESDSSNDDMLIRLLPLALRELSSVIGPMLKSSSRFAGADSVRPRKNGDCAGGAGGNGVSAPNPTGVIGAHGIMRPSPHPKACRGAAPCFATLIVRLGLPGRPLSSSSAPRNIGGRLDPVSEKPRILAGGASPKAAMLCPCRLDVTNSSPLLARVGQSGLLGPSASPTQVRRVVLA